MATELRPAPAARPRMAIPMAGEPTAVPRLRLATPVPMRAPAPLPAPAPRPAPANPVGQSERDLLDGSAVRSVDRAAALLLAFADFPAEAGVTELARKLGLHKSTASRPLATLERRGLV